MRSIKIKPTLLFRNIRYITLYLILILPVVTAAQSSYFNQDEWHTSYFIDRFKLDLPKSSRKIENKGEPYQFAIPYEVNKSIYQTDEDKSQDGYYHYFLNLNVPDAYALNFTLKGLNENNVVAVYIIDSKENIDGPYTADQNSFDLTPFPNYMTNDLTIEIISINKLYVNRLFLYRIGIVYDKELLNISAECNVDVNCVEGDNWQDVKRSVVRILFNNGYLCTGTILNNTLNDERPYLLTANHCISTPQGAANAIFAFNYEAPYCDAPRNEYPGESTNRLVGANLRATKYDVEGKLDFSLLELNDDIPASFNVHFSGWSASSNPPRHVAGIHHPAGDVKKIAIDYNALQVGTFSSEYNENSFWRVLKWDIGVTEGGSSGSAIFNEHKQVVGDLTGGEATCDYPYNDFYSRFDLAYDKYSDSAQQLKYWLDPAHYEVRSWFGIPNDEIEDSTQVYIYPIPAYQRFQVYSPTLTGPVKVVLFDMNGIMTWENEYVADQRILFVNVPSNLSGMYYMRIETNNGVLKRKMVFY